MAKGEGAKIPEWKPGMPSRWLHADTGGKYGTGRRVVDNALVVHAVARMMMMDHGVRRITVHEGRCNVGRTTPDPCNCTPTVLKAQVRV